jgi:predicted ribonuclease YlaK
MEKGEKATLVTKKIIVRLKSKMLGVAAEDFTTEQAPKIRVTEKGYVENV